MAAYWESHLVVLAFAALVLAAAVSDVRSMTIPNRLSLAVAALWPVSLLATWAGWHEVIWSMGVGVGVLAILFGLFALRVVGGGDAKLAAAVSLWAGPALIGEFLLVTAASGGVVALAALLLRPLGRRVALQPTLHAIAGLAEQRIELPYGVAIAAGGIWVALRLIGL